MHSLWEQKLEQTLNEQRARGLSRKMVDVEEVHGPEITIDNQRVLLFSSNDYLGYTQHPALKEAARKAADEWGVGAGASRLISGNLGLNAELEKKTSSFKHTDDALVFCTGFMANLGVVAGLAGPGDIIISDSLNHASLVDACRLSKAEVRIVPHADVSSFKKAMSDISDQRAVILTDGVFSMDGDVAPLADLAELAESKGALLIVDDAHGTGVLGETGRGSLEYSGVDPKGVVQIGTFSKALGGLGGFAAGPELVIEYLRNRSRTLFYTTGLPPSVLASNIKSLSLVDQEPETRARLHENISNFKQQLVESGLRPGSGPTAIVPIMIGETDPTLAMAAQLRSTGLYCPAMRPPTVPPGECRLRLSLMATHTSEQVERAVSLIIDAAHKTGVLS